MSVDPNPRPVGVEPQPPRLAPIAPTDPDASGVPNLVKVLAHHPALQQAWRPFAQHVLFDQAMPRRDREIAMLRIGWLNGCEYEWKQHLRLARRAGVTGEEIQRIANGDLAGWSPAETAVLRAVDDLFANSTIDDQTWDALRANYDTEQVLDLIFTIGQYNLVSWFLNSVAVPLDEGL